MHVSKNELLDSSLDPSLQSLDLQSLEDRLNFYKYLGSIGKVVQFYSPNYNERLLVGRKKT